MIAANQVEIKAIHKCGKQTNKQLNTIDESFPFVLKREKYSVLMRIFLLILLGKLFLEM